MKERTKTVALDLVPEMGTVAKEKEKS